MQSNFSFLRQKPALILTAFLLVQAGLVHGFKRSEVIAPHHALKELSTRLGSWMLQQETQVDKDTLDVLQAHDTLSRTYVNPQLGVGAHLFVAYFETQRAGQTPHSPKNCLPGAGWVPSAEDFIKVDVPGRAPIEVNRYIVQRGNAKSLVLYWYQSRDRVVASEYAAKFYVVADAIRYNRTDTALVRVIVTIPQGEGPENAEKTAKDFVAASFTPLRQIFPL